LNTWNDDIQRAMAHPIKRRIIECLRDANLSFTELLHTVDESNHGRFGYHLRTLKGFVELEPSTKRYHLTDRGRLLAAIIRYFRFIISTGKRPEKYVQGLRFGDHAVGFWDTEDFKRKISLPFLKAGLPKGEAVVYVVSEHKLNSEAREILNYGISGDYIRNGAFTIMSAYEWYLEKGKAQAKTITANWERLIKEKQKAGFTGVRVAGEMDTFFNNAKVDELLKYEESLGRQLPLDLCGLCLYDIDRLDKEQFIRVCNYHGHMISKGIVGKTIE